MSVSQLNDRAVQNAVGITGYPPFASFQDTALPIVTLNVGATDTEIVDFTPPFFTYDKHYLVTWTTLFQGAGAGTTGSIKYGICQNATPLVLPLVSQESTGNFDCASELTAPNLDAVIVSQSVVYLTESAGGLPPHIAIFFQSTNLGVNNVSCQIREISVIKLD